MSVQVTNLLLGQGELYFKRHDGTSGKYRRVGSLKGVVTLTHEVEYAEQQPGNKLTSARRDKIREKAILTANVCDFKIPQLIAALGQSISTTQLTVTSTLRVWEEIQLGASTTTEVTLSRLPVSMTSVVVTEMDESAVLVKGTDYSSSIPQHLVPKSASFKNKWVRAAYDYKDASATVMRVGDKFTLQVVDLKYTFKELQSGKFITIEIPRATINGGLEIPFAMNEYTQYQITFSALGDMTQPEGRSLFKVIREA